MDLTSWETCLHGEKEADNGVAEGGNMVELKGDSDGATSPLDLVKSPIIDEYEWDPIWPTRLQAATAAIIIFEIWLKKKNEESNWNPEKMKNPHQS